jgi:hypothetical protein
MENFVIQHTLTFEDKELKTWKETYSTESEALNTYMELVAENIAAFPKNEAWDENGSERGLLSWWFFEIGGFEHLTMQLDFYKEKRKRVIKK